MSQLEAAEIYDPEGDRATFLNPAVLESEAVQTPWRKPSKG